ncbi:MAG: polyprenyl synthetase family protein, partial [Chitinophagaceae bacterium]
VYALWKNKVSVLVGDYLLAKGLLLALDNSDFRVLQILSTAVRQMSEGELLQMEKSRSLNLDENVYFEIIRSKTASLLSAACAAGAFSASGDESLALRMQEFGEKVGVAFQIKDDLFDYGFDNVGKPTGNDIKEKKLTLPLIYTLNNVDKPTRRKLIYIIKNKNTNKKDVAIVLKAVSESGGIDYTIGKMQQYKSEALNILDAFPDSEIKTGFRQLVNYVTERKY